MLAKRLGPRQPLDCEPSAHRKNGRARRQHQAGQSLHHVELNASAFASVLGRHASRAGEMLLDLMLAQHRGMHQGRAADAIVQCHPVEEAGAEFAHRASEEIDILAEPDLGVETPETLNAVATDQGGAADEQRLVENHSRGEAETGAEAAADRGAPRGAAEEGAFAAHLLRRARRRTVRCGQTRRRRRDAPRKRRSRRHNDPQARDRRRRGSARTGRGRAASRDCAPRSESRRSARGFLR